MHLHDFLKVGMLPIAIGRILVHATPCGIHEVELRSKRLARHALKLFVTPQGLSHTILDDVPVEPFLHRTPTPIAMVVSLNQHPAQFVACLRSQGSFSNRSQLRLGNDRRAWGRVIDDRLQHRRHRARRNVAPAFDDLASVSTEDDRRRPTVIFVSV